MLSSGLSVWTGCGSESKSSDVLADEFFTVTVDPDLTVIVDGLKPLSEKVIVEASDVLDTGEAEDDAELDGDVDATGAV